MKGLTREAVKNQLSFDIMKSLLQKDQSLILNQFKSNRNFTDSTIEISSAGAARSDKLII